VDKVFQDELKGSKHYKDLALKLKLVEIDELLRCKGRLECLDLEPESEEPIILPRDDKLTILVIECHRKTKHSGIRATLGELRLRFWVAKGRQAGRR